MEPQATQHNPVPQVEQVAPKVQESEPVAQVEPVEVIDRPAEVKAASPKRKKKRRGCCGVIFLLLTILFLIIVGVVAYLIYSYMQWEEGFNRDLATSNVIEVDIAAFDYTPQRNSALVKIDSFVDSEEELNFVELTKEEAAVLFADTIADALPEYLELEKFYLETADGEWNVYIQLSAQEEALPVLHLVVVKDAVEGAEIFVEDIYVGPVNLENLGLNSLKHTINRAYYDAVLTVNDNNYASHTIENIELEEGSIIIKGRRN
ncbi:MAG: hypothetical protein QY318_01870 [Candidatus Dojkabacteria bacterium]|nr:MAG: hypothetical protein QY318_01870 [Candidatus Dojkabacteria bacterium]